MPVVEAETLALIACANESNFRPDPNYKHIGESIFLVFRCKSYVGVCTTVNCAGGFFFIQSLAAQCRVQRRHIFVVRIPLKSTEFSRSQGGSDPIRNSAANCFNTQKSCLLKTRHFDAQDALKQTHNLSHAGARARM